LDNAINQVLFIVVNVVAILKGLCWVCIVNPNGEDLDWRMVTEPPQQTEKETLKHLTSNQII